MHCAGMGLAAESPMAIKSLRRLATAEENCRRCPLYRDATQAVPGEGPQRAAFMLVGEQPGDKEDLAGKPARRHRSPLSAAAYRGFVADLKAAAAAGHARAGGKP
jgi:uracil-DNA glycosylase